MPVLKSSDLYECAYYFSNGCTVKDIELVEENKKQVCFLFMTGENLLFLQQNYFKSEALVNLFDFRRAYNRLMNLIALAKKEATARSKEQAGQARVSR
ncbi:MAG: hypothetical protein JXB50_09765 [Spirochaetes bacterium]|nr:hypothetical protein [Spirochaetota bacterium]